MKINEISNLNYVANVKKVNKTKQVSGEKNTDKVEFSREAKELSKAAKTLSSERLAEITKRLHEKFYDREEVLRVVADRILKSSRFQDGAPSKRLDQNL